MNLLNRLFSKACGHMRSVVIDRYPKTDWRDAGDDSKIHFCRGPLKMRCLRCNHVYLQGNEFITRHKETGKISNL